MAYHHFFVKYTSDLAASCPLFGPNLGSNGFSRSPFFARLDALGLAYTYRGKEAPQ